MKKFLCLSLLIVSVRAYSFSPYWVGAGSITHNFLTAQNDTKGGTVKFAFAPVLLAGVNVPFFYSGLFLSPGIGFAKFSTEDNTSKQEFILQYHMSKQIVSMFLFQFGFSNYITKISGEGGTRTLGNGTGTATFYTPERNETSYTSSLDLGGDFILSNSLSARLQFSIMRFLSSERRRVSHLITLNYFF